MSHADIAILVMGVVVVLVLLAAVLRTFEVFDEEFHDDDRS